MKKPKNFALALLCVGFLCACSKGQDYALDDPIYVSTLSYHSDYKIMQLTDIHWELMTDVEKESKYLTDLVKAANPDLIMITGDSVLDANEAIIRKLYDTVDSWNIPWNFTFGNHDFQGLYSSSWLKGYLGGKSNSLYKDINDNIMGNSNQVINLMKGDKCQWQIYTIDSNSSVNASLTSNIYDYIHDDEVNWFLAQSKKAEADNGGTNVPSLCYFHIPLWEWVYSYWENKPSVIGTIGQKSTNTVDGLTNSEHPTIPLWPAGTNGKMFSAAKERKVKGMFTGHDHFNDWVTSYEGLTFGYGVKTGRGLEFTTTSEKIETGKGSEDAFEMTGASIVTLHDDSSYTLTHFFMDSDDHSLTHSYSVEVA